MFLKKANFRRTNVATKLKLTYVKDNFLDVSPYIPRFILTYPWFVRSKFSTKLVGVNCFCLLTLLIKISPYFLGDDWTDCFFIPKLSLPPNPFLGFSAMTGDVSDAHEYALSLSRTLTLFHLHAPPFSIISVSSYTAILSRPDSGRDKIKERPPHPTEEGTWFGLLFKLLLLAGVVAGGYYGYQEYLRRQMYGGGGTFTDMFSSSSRLYWLRSVR